MEAEKKAFKRERREREKVEMPHHTHARTHARTHTRAPECDRGRRRRQKKPSSQMMAPKGSEDGKEIAVNRKLSEFDTFFSVTFQLSRQRRRGWCGQFSSTPDSSLWAVICKVGAAPERPGELLMTGMSLAFNAFRK